MADIKSKGKQLPEQTGGSKGKEKNSGNSSIFLFLLLFFFFLI